MPFHFSDSPISQPPSRLHLDEAVYAALIDTIDQSVILTDMEGRIRVWNSGATRIFGYPAEEMLGETPALLYPEEDPRRFAEDLERILGGEDFVGEWCGRRRDGSTVWVEIRTTVVRDSAGTPIGCLGVGREITERTRNESAQRKHQVLEALARLTAMLGETRFLLGRTDISGTVRQEVTRIQRAAERITEITRQLLAFSGRQFKEPHSLDPNGAINRYRLDLQHFLGDSIELCFGLSPGVPPVRIDEAQLQQVLTDLVRHARDAMTEGGTLFLGTRELSISESSAATHGVTIEPGRYVELMVGEPGAGKDSDAMAPLVVQEDGGGLATVYWVVKQSGGYLFAKTSPFGGDGFRILLPAAIEE